jgi:PAS domain S-box-containing protein
MNREVREILLQLFDQMSANPQTPPPVPAGSWPEGSQEWQLLSNFRNMLCTLHQSKQDGQVAEEPCGQALPAASDGLWDWDLATDQVYYSPRWKSMLGFAEDEITPDCEEWLKRIHPDDFVGVLKTLRAQMDGPPAVYTYEHRLQHKDGSYRWVLARSASLREASGKPARIFGTLADITEYKRAEEQLREREAQYRSIFEASNDGMVIRTLDGVAVEANPAACAMHGYSYEEFLGLPRIAIVHPDSYPLTAEFWHAIQTRGHFSCRAIDLRKDGTPFPVEVHGSTFTFKGQPHTLSVIRDISERERAEEQLREREAQYRGIFESSSDGLIIGDWHDTIVEANPAACAMWGISYEEFVGSSATAYLHPDSYHLLSDARHTIAEGGRFQSRGVGLRKDGTSFDLEVHSTAFTYKGKPHRLSVLRDITEQVHAYQLLEQRVEERTHELSTLLEVSHTVASTLELKPLLALILDQLKAVINYSGASICIIKGGEATVVDCRGRQPTELALRHRFSLHQADQIMEILQRREPIIIADLREHTALTKSWQCMVGTLPDWNSDCRQASLIAVPLMPKEQVIGILTLTAQEPHYFTPHYAALALAFANQVAIALENAQLYEQAHEWAATEERQRLARELHDSVSQALYGIALGAHTARTLLDRDPHQVVEPLNYVLSLAEAALVEMRALIFELRPESLVREGLVSALAQQAAAIQARHRLVVATAFGEEPAQPVKVKQELYRVAQEALQNTVKHARANTVELRLSENDAQLVLEVCDDGVGFDPDGSYPGHLGLQSMRERVYGLGGTLQIQSAAGAGTCICARIPSHAGESDS